MASEKRVDYNSTDPSTHSLRSLPRDDKVGARWALGRDDAKAVPSLPRDDNRPGDPSSISPTQGETEVPARFVDDVSGAIRVTQVGKVLVVGAIEDIRQDQLNTPMAR